MPFIPGSPGMPSGPAPTGGGGGAGPRSLVLASASSQFLSRLWTRAQTDNTRFTLSIWVKRASTGAVKHILYDAGPWNGAGSSEVFGFDQSTPDRLELVAWNGSSVTSMDQSIDTITDTTTWHHVCQTVDTNLGTPPTQMHLYIDGVEVTYAVVTGFPGSGNAHIADNGLTSFIGCEAGGGNFTNAKLAYYYLIDGQVLPPSNFTTGTGPGTIHPAAYGGSFGNNGFFLDFRGSNTNDQSGVNTNNWTPNGGPTFSTDLPT